MKPLDWIAATLAWAMMTATLVTIAVVLTVHGLRESVGAFVGGAAACFAVGAAGWMTVRFVRIVKGH